MRNVNSRRAAALAFSTDSRKTDVRSGERSPGDRPPDARRSEGSEGRNRRGQLTRQDALLLAVSGLNSVANALSGTFVNVYLWKVKNDFAMIAWFTLVHQFALALTFWLAGKWVKEQNKMNALRLGIGISALFYLLVLWLGPRAVQFIVPLGIVQGVAGGLFWLAFNVIYFEVTNSANRDRFNGWTGLLGSFSGMVAPWVSGLLITRLGGGAGYRLIFTLSLTLFLVGVFVSFFLRKRKAEGRYDWLFGYKMLKKRDNEWRRIGGALYAQGLKEGVFSFLIVLLVYVVTKNEMKLGNYWLITSAVALVSFWLVGRVMKPRYRKWGMFVGVTAMAAVVLPFFWRVDYGTLLLFGVVTSLFTPLFSVPVTSAVFDVIGKNKENASHREEFVVLREAMLAFGRMTSTLLFLAVVSVSMRPPVINTLLFALSCAPLLTWFLLRDLLTLRHPDERKKHVPERGRQVSEEHRRQVPGEREREVSDERREPISVERGEQVSDERREPISVERGEQVSGEPAAQTPFRRKTLRPGFRPGLAGAYRGMLDVNVNRARRRTLFKRPVDPADFARYVKRKPFRFH